MRLASTFAALAVSALAAGFGDTAAPAGVPARAAVAAARTLSVYISGPSVVAPAGPCTWEAWVSGGTPPYTYHWSNNRSSYVGTDSTYQAGFIYSGTITLTVTDADNQTATDTHGVSVSRWVAPCEPV